MSQQSLADELKADIKNKHITNPDSTYNKIINKMKENACGYYIMNSELGEITTELLKEGGLFLFSGKHINRCDCDWRDSCGNHPQKKTYISLYNKLPHDSTYLWRKI